MKAVFYAAFLFASLFANNQFAAEETIRGVLEKTVKPGACAQIKDALNEWYFVIKTEESEKLIAPFVGKNKRVVIVGTQEQREGDPAYYFNLKSAEEYVPPVSKKDATAPAGK